MPTQAAATSQGPTTRNRPTQSQTGDPHISREDLIKTSRVISNEKHARDFLDKNGYTPKSDSTTIETLSYALLSLTHSATYKTLQDEAQAITILLELESTKRTGEGIVSYIIQKLSLIIDSAEDALTGVNTATEDIWSAVDRLYSTWEETRDEIQKSVEGINAAIENTKPTAQNPPPPATDTSYIAALTRQLLLSHQNNLACNCTREKQILIDKDPHTTSNNLAELMETELVAKANEANEQMKAWLEGNKFDDVRFIGARHLSNGGIIYKLNSTEATKIICKERETFIEHFGGTSIAKNRAATVIIEYFPISHSINFLGEYRKVERDLGLEPDSLLST